MDMAIKRQKSTNLVVLSPSGLCPAVSVALPDQVVLDRAVDISGRLKWCKHSPPWACQPGQGLVLAQDQKIHGHYKLCLLHPRPIGTFAINTPWNEAQGISGIRNTELAMKSSLFLLFLCLQTTSLCSFLSSHKLGSLLVLALQTPDWSAFPWDTLHSLWLEHSAWTNSFHKMDKRFKMQPSERRLLSYLFSTKNVFIGFSI